MDLSTVLIATLIVPLLATLLLAVLPAKRVPRFAFEGIHLVAVVAMLCLGVYLCIQVFSNDSDVSALGNWFRLDGLGAIFWMLIVVIGALVGIFSVPYIAHDAEEYGQDEASGLSPQQVKIYYVFFSLFLFTMLLVASSNNIVMMWVCIEATTLATVFLVGLYQNKLSLEAAWKYIIVCTTGVAFGLYGVLLVYASAAAVMPDPADAIFWTSLLPYASQLDPTTVSIAFVFILIGFGTKAGLFPMHTWLPDAHSEAPSPVSALLSGVLLKCAILVIIRFYIVTVAAIGITLPRVLLLTLGGLSVVYAAFALFKQDDVKRKLAYSSTENIGIIALCLGLGGPLGIAAALLHCIFHACTKALMFCLTGNILMKYGTRSLEKINGILEVAPVTGVLLVLGCLALSAFPPFAMFTSEITMFMSMLSQGYLWLAIIIGLALTIVIAAFMIMAVRAVFGHAPEGMKKKELPALALIPEFLLLIAVLWFGIAMPAPLVQDIQDATAIVLQQPVQLEHENPLIGGIAGTADIDSTAK